MNVLHQSSGKNHAVYHGDSCELIKGIADNSLHYTIFSPPFSSLYTYSNSERDMGNSKSDEEFYTHFRFLAVDLYRVMMPGRLLSFHCMNIPSMKERDGVIGIKDFRGDMIRLFQSVGFIFHSEVCIWKDPLIEATRTKALGLMHKQIQKDSAMCRNGLPDYLITMRKPGENPELVAHPQGFTAFIGDDEPIARKGIPVIQAGDSRRDRSLSTTKDDPIYSHQVWRRYASPVWMDINQSDTLQKESAREERDERHIAPLQLQVIRRGIELWTNPGDVVFDPFGGIGSTPHEAILAGRRGMAFELKESYYNQMAQNCRNAEREAHIPTLFDFSETEAELPDDDELAEVS